MKGIKAPVPTRGRNSDVNGEPETNGMDGHGQDMDENNSLRVNISSQITPNLISELADKNWKVSFVQILFFIYF